MIAKLIGGIFIMCGCIYIGFGTSLNMRRREKFLLNFKSFLKLLEVEMEFSSCRLKNLLLRIDKNVSLGGLLEKAANDVEKYGVQIAWENSVKTQTPFSCKSDRDTMSLLGAELGMTDKESQIKNIHHINELIEKQYEDACKKREQLSKLYESGGILCGILIVILLY